VGGGDLDEDEVDAVGVGDPALAEAPGLELRGPADIGAGGDEARVLGVDVVDLQPQRAVAGGRRAVAADQLEEAAAQEEHGAGHPAPEAVLAVDPQSQHVAVPAQAVLERRGT
jgi:hypothetical protein